MKKLLFSIVCVAFAYGANAQIKKATTSIADEVKTMPMTTMSEAPVVKTVETPSYYNQSTVITNTLVPKKTQKSGNYSYYGYVQSTWYAISTVGKAASQWGGEGAKSATFMLFPDSLGISYRKIDGTSVVDSGFNNHTLPSIGFTFDPYSKSYDSEYSQRLLADDQTGEVCGYRIDTLLLNADYRMANFDPSNPDILRIFITKHNAYNMPTGEKDPKRDVQYFAGHSYNGKAGENGTTFCTPIVKFDNINNIPQKGSVVKPVADNLMVIDYVLGPKDSVDIEGYVSGGGQYGYGVIFRRTIQIPLVDYEGAYEVPVGYVTSIVMKFIPGYDYDLGDTIQKMYYNASTKEYTNLETRKNTFSASVLWDSDNFDNFCDIGGGYSCRLAESPDVRYNKSTYYQKDYNPLGFMAYVPNYYAIPYAWLGISIDDDNHLIPDNAVVEPNAIVSKIYPNPANNLLKVELINSEVAELTVLNTVGQIVKTVSLNEMNNSIDISTLCAGMYMLKVSQNGSTYTTKITKK